MQRGLLRLIKLIYQEPIVSDHLLHQDYFAILDCIKELLRFIARLEWNMREYISIHYHIWCEIHVLHLLDNL
jgi:hypothetical protein